VANHRSKLAEQDVVAFSQYKPAQLDQPIPDIDPFPPDNSFEMNSGHGT
jgi:hypothetical protein